MKRKSATPPARMSDITIENARLAFRNFSGKEGRFNPAGRRNVCILLDSDVAERLAEIGWNVKWLEPRDANDDKQAYIQVTISYKNIPPKIVVITKRKTILDEDSVHVLDWAEIETADVIIRPYIWEVNGKTGVKAYLKTMYVTLVEDQFEGKYVNIPDAAVSHQSEEREED